MSHSLRLTPEQGEVFLARLADENAKESEAKIAAQLQIGVAALKKHMNVIYDRTSNEFPSLAKIQGRGKLKELRACLKDSWKKVVQSNQSSDTQGLIEFKNLGEQRNLKLSHKSSLKPGAPFPRVRLPQNFVKRPDALNAVKEKLLAESDQPLVVSAIAGLGGLGKSVLAAALVLDEEVQERFADGILWVTLGQEPDLQTLLGEWIRELDKSREVFSANTLESASRYLYNLLVERRMLLVVDDVWNAAHVKWFQMGGVGCRVLVTTREAVILGADRYDLDLMSPQESLELTHGELGDKWTTAMEQPALEFAKLLGYLPLALRLMAVQILRGRKWETLKKAFLQETERLRSLDQPGVRLAEISVDERRKYSLRACFQLSLDRLKLDKPEVFERFVWLGVLPEDVEIQQQMSMTLWDVQDWEAEETLLDLYERSLLTSGVATIEGERTYRVHDLMHDMARGLIEEGILDLPIPNPPAQQYGALSKGQNLPLAHRQFLERYREQAIDRRWDKLLNDGYIHRHLTWHMEQANWLDAIHILMTMSDELGRNAWFEVCNRIGQPTVFVEDVARGWRVAERSYEQDQIEAIVLQCRYALITATLNSLISNLPIGMMVEFVKRAFWTVEHAWVYVEQIQYEATMASAIQALAPHLSKVLLQVALEAGWVIQNDFGRARLLSALAKVDMTYFSEALEAARAIQNEFDRARALSALAEVDTADFAARLEAARAIQDESSRARALSALAKVDTTYFSEALEAARAIQNESSRADVLCQLAGQAPQNFLSNLGDAILELTHKPTCAEALSTSLFHFSLSTLPNSDWQTYLHLLACRKRSDLMQDLATLYPAILYLGGEAAMRGIVNAMSEVCSQWK